MQDSALKIAEQRDGIEKIKQTELDPLWEEVNNEVTLMSEFALFFKFKTEMINEGKDDTRNRDKVFCHEIISGEASQIIQSCSANL